MNPQWRELTDELAFWPVSCPGRARVSARRAGIQGPQDGVAIVVLHDSCAGSRVSFRSASPRCTRPGHVVWSDMPAKPTWKELLARSEPLILPCAHDALSARLIERAGFAAYSVGGYALVGARHALPDIGLVGFGEMSAGIRDIMAATSLPVLVDCDDGYGDVKNVARTIAGYEAMGVSAIFMEDQRAPKRCGHMAGKDVIEADAMAAKLRAAVAARRGADLFIIARTDARAVHGLDEALRRGEIYLKAGADGLFIEAPQSIDELTRIGRTFQGVPQLANIVA